MKKFNFHNKVLKIMIKGDKMLKAYLITSDVDINKIKEFAKGVKVINCPCKNQTDIISNCKDADILISIYEKIDKDVIDSLENLKYICIGSIGYNNVDVDYAKKKGILVSNNPTYCIEEVADHTLALMLNCLRKINQFNNDIKEYYQWDYNRYGKNIRRMKELTVALIGFGNIAKKVNERLRGFGCEVIVCDPYLDEQTAIKNNVKIVDLKYVQEKADIISIHTPLTESTKNLLNEDFFYKSKQCPIIINCSRGEIIDENSI